MHTLVAATTTTKIVLVRCQPFCQWAGRARDGEHTVKMPFASGWAIREWADTRRAAQSLPAGTVLHIESTTTDMVYTFRVVEA